MGQAGRRPAPCKRADVLDVADLGKGFVERGGHAPVDVHAGLSPSKPPSTSTGW